jgi:oligoribonuclease NrnB/cAMP/cGMP phosphodiesterase (DHH superfamily)
MPQINQKQAKDFLNDISDKDKVAIMFHNDLDGFVAGILLANWCETKGAKITPIPFALTDDQNKAIKEIGNSNKVLIADLGPTTIIKVLEAIKDKQVFYTDHHIKDIEIPKEIKEYRTPEDLPSSKAVYKLIGGSECMSILSEFADAGWKVEENKKAIGKFLKEHKLTMDEFFKNYDYKFERTTTYFHKDLKKGFEVLRKIQTLEDFNKLNEYDSAVGKEIHKFVKDFESKEEIIGNVHFYYFEPEYPIKSAIINEISYSNPNNIYIFAVPSKEVVSLSARNQTRTENMVELLKKATKGIDEANVGGHIPAAGAKIPKKDLEKLKENLKGMTKR